MARYIDANKLIENLVNRCFYPPLLFKIVDDTPTEDVAHVIHAYWIERFDEDSKWLICSNCHQDQDYDKSTKFCPCCGAKMGE